MLPYRHEPLFYLDLHQHLANSEFISRLLLMRQICLNIEKNEESLHQDKSMKNIALVAFTLAIVGCASAPSQGYRPANYSGTPWNISGELNQFSNGVVIKINNQSVIQGSLSLLTSDGEFSGTYEGRPVNASCLTSMGLFSNKTNCFVFINGEKAATLTF